MHASHDMTPEELEPGRPGRFGWIFVGLSIPANLWLLAAAWRDRSWEALWIAIVGGPLVNAVWLLVGLVAIPFLKRRRAGFALGRHLAFSCGVPIAAVVIDLGLIASMGLHGC